MNLTELEKRITSLIERASLEELEENQSQIKSYIALLFRVIYANYGNALELLTSHSINAEMIDPHLPLVTDQRNVISEKACDHYSQEAFAEVKLSLLDTFKLINNETNKKLSLLKPKDVKASQDHTDPVQPLATHIKTLTRLNQIFPLTMARLVLLQIFLKEDPEFLTVENIQWILANTPQKDPEEIRQKLINIVASLEKHPDSEILTALKTRITNTLTLCRVSDQTNSILKKLNTPQARIEYLQLLIWQYRYLEKGNNFCLPIHFFSLLNNIVQHIPSIFFPLGNSSKQKVFSAEIVLKDAGVTDVTLPDQETMEKFLNQLPGLLQQTINDILTFAPNSVTIYEITNMIITHSGLGKRISYGWKNNKLVIVSTPSDQTLPLQLTSYSDQYKPTASQEYYQHLITWFDRVTHIHIGNLLPYLPQMQELVTSMEEVNKKYACILTSNPITLADYNTQFLEMFLNIIDDLHRRVILLKLECSDLKTSIAAHELSNRLSDLFINTYELQQTLCSDAQKVEKEESSKTLENQRKEQQENQENLDILRSLQSGKAPLILDDEHRLTETGIRGLIQTAPQAIQLAYFNQLMQELSAQFLKRRETGFNIENMIRYFEKCLDAGSFLMEDDRVTYAHDATLSPSQETFLKMYKAILEMFDTLPDQWTLNQAFTEIKKLTGREILNELPKLVIIYTTNKLAQAHLPESETETVKDSLYGQAKIEVNKQLLLTSFSHIKSLEDNYAWAELEQKSKKIIIVRGNAERLYKYLLSQPLCVFTEIELKQLESRMHQLRAASSHPKVDLDNPLSSTSPEVSLDNPSPFALLEASLEKTALSALPEAGPENPSSSSSTPLSLPSYEDTITAMLTSAGIEYHSTLSVEHIQHYVAQSFQYLSPFFSDLLFQPKRTHINITRMPETVFGTIISQYEEAKLSLMDTAFLLRNLLNHPNDHEIYLPEEAESPSMTVQTAEQVEKLKKLDSELSLTSNHLRYLSPLTQEEINSSLKPLSIFIPHSTSDHELRRHFFRLQKFSLILNEYMRIYGKEPELNETLEQFRKLLTIYTLVINTYFSIHHSPFESDEEPYVERLGYLLNTSIKEFNHLLALYKQKPDQNLSEILFPLAQLVQLVSLKYSLSAKSTNPKERSFIKKLKLETLFAKTSVDIQDFLHTRLRNASPNEKERLMTMIISAYIYMIGMIDEKHQEGHLSPDDSYDPRRHLTEELSHYTLLPDRVLTLLEILQLQNLSIKFWITRNYGARETSRFCKEYLNYLTKEVKEKLDTSLKSTSLPKHYETLAINLLTRNIYNVANNLVTLLISHNSNPETSQIIKDTYQNCLKFLSELNDRLGKDPIRSRLLYTNPSNILVKSTPAENAKAITLMMTSFSFYKEISSFDFSSEQELETIYDTLTTEHANTVIVKENLKQKALQILLVKTIIAKNESIGENYKKLNHFIETQELTAVSFDGSLLLPEDLGKLLCHYRAASVLAKKFSRSIPSAVLTALAKFNIKEMLDKLNNDKQETTPEYHPVFVKTLFEQTDKIFPEIIEMLEKQSPQPGELLQNLKTQLDLLMTTKLCPTELRSKYKEQIKKQTQTPLVTPPAASTEVVVLKKTVAEKKGAHPPRPKKSSSKETPHTASSAAVSAVATHSSSSSQTKEELRGTRKATHHQQQPDEAKQQELTTSLGESLTASKTSHGTEQSNPSSEPMKVEVAVIDRPAPAQLIIPSPPEPEKQTGSNTNSESSSEPSTTPSPAPPRKPLEPSAAPFMIFSGEDISGETHFAKTQEELQGRIAARNAEHQQKWEKQAHEKASAQQEFHQEAFSQHQHYVPPHQRAPFYVRPGQVGFGSMFPHTMLPPPVFQPAYPLPPQTYMSGVYPAWLHPQQQYPHPYDPQNPRGDGRF